MSAEPNFTIQAEAAMISNYLIGNRPEGYMVTLYEQAVSSIAIQPSEQRLVNFAFKHRWLLRSIDSGLAILSPNHELRRRIFIIFSLLEASPMYTKSFLPIKRSPFYLLAVGLRGIDGILQAVLGILIIKLGNFST